MKRPLLASASIVLLAACQPAVVLPERTWIHSGSPQPASTRLTPGDVLHIRRWSPGSAEAINTTTPPSFIDRIPIRHVTEGTMLDDHERQFVIDVITTGRSDWNQIKELPSKRGPVRSNEAAVWNAIHANTTLELTTNGVLGLVLDRGKVANAVKPVAELLDPNQTALFGRASAGEPYALVLTTKPASTGNPFYYDASKGVPLHDFVTVEKAGVDMARHEWPERQWTLEQWQDSRICQGRSGDRMVDMTIAGLTVGGEYFELANEPDRATHAVNMAPRRGEAVNPDGLLFPPWRLARTVLNDLTAEDVQAVHWRPSTGPARNVTPPTRCKAK